jgi:hypothetical protein
MENAGFDAPFRKGEEPTSSEGKASIFVEAAPKVVVWFRRFEFQSNDTLFCPGNTSGCRVPEEPPPGAM